MSIFIKTLSIVLFLSVIGPNRMHLSQEKPKTEPGTLPSGIYLLNDSAGVKRVLKDKPNEYYFIQKRPWLPIGNFDKVKRICLEEKYFKASEKQCGLSFTLNPKGRSEIQNLSSIGMRTRQKLGLIVKDELIFALHVGSEINGESFFIELYNSKDEMKRLEKMVKNELKEFK
ncbi:hypothetical protein Q4603_15465 [Zobellia galactanivorans]|uniref:hypothetical protein n=1 Tax=Zobellia galactanivorans (strain DSM 12802 / CCUG 47099 / CIP 106680 / NCIMB 13871 / Dsij) TaxID=63186 RepID=UPI0026E20A7A|nr:hypothetical protein [Zobellia galactanivorans]MDO6810022.1 hypothetical protein [Zobellia galactanivorans]